ncbi:hypothetical protein TNCV_5123591 [Trichonephila clavipes]|nr:hypothetical protein TNCV_5123591 [Trichonephila clavipes]
MAAVDFLHQENPPTWAEVETATLGTEDQLEVGESHVVVSRWLQMARKWSPGYGINSKQVVLSPGRRKTAPQLACDLAAVSGRRISQHTAHSCLAETSFYARRPVCYVPLTASSRENRISWS